MSGAWWAQVIGGWDEIDEESGLPKRERISQLLFDKEKGIAAPPRAEREISARYRAGHTALTPTAAMTGAEMKTPCGCSGRR